MAGGSEQQLSAGDSLCPSSGRPCLPRGRNSSPIPWKQGGGLLEAWPCHSPGFTTLPAIPFPPPPRVANRGGLVPAPIELPCSPHTKNGNPQAISGAVPSWAVATAPLLPPGCWTLLRDLGPAFSLWDSLSSTLVGSWLGGADPGLREALPQAAWQMGGGRVRATWPGQRQVGKVSPGLGAALHQPGVPGRGPPGAGEDGVAMVFCSRQALAGAYREGSGRRAGTQGLRRPWGWGTQLDMVTSSGTSLPHNPGPWLCSDLQEKK